MSIALVIPSAGCGRYGFENLTPGIDATSQDGDSETSDAAAAGDGDVRDAMGPAAPGDAEEPTDAVVADADVSDGTVSDASSMDAALEDASTTDAAVTDAAVTDAAVTDAAVTDAAVADATVTDASVADAMATDASTTDGGGTPTISLLHWYRFDGSGTVVADSVGVAHGECLGGASLSGSGTVVLSGGTSERYVNLPNRLISTLTSASIEVWIVWSGSGGYQRIFDFGASDAGEGAQGTGTTQLSLAIDGTSPGTLRLLFDATPATTSDGWRVAWGFNRLTSNVRHQVVATFDATPSPNVLALYLDGAFVSSTTVPDAESLGAIDDVNAWLGRGQAFADPELGGVLHDARIYSGALTVDNVSVRFATGPDAL